MTFSVRLNLSCILSTLHLQPFTAVECIEKQHSDYLHCAKIHTQCVYDPSVLFNNWCTIQMSYLYYAIVLYHKRAGFFFPKVTVHLFDV